MLSEERARIYSSDSDEGSEEDKAQRLLKAKKLNSDEVSVGLSAGGLGRGASPWGKAALWPLTHGRADVGTGPPAGQGLPGLTRSLRVQGLSGTP